MPPLAFCSLSAIGFDCISSSEADMRSCGVVRFSFLVGFGGRVSGSWWRVVVVALACGAVVLSGALSRTAPSPRANGVGGAAALARLQSLPLQAQSVISAKLGAGAASCAAVPAGGGRPLTLALRLGGSLRAVRAGRGLQFVSPSGRVAARYGGLVALDARGRRLPAALGLGGGSLRLRVDDHGARYPLRIDPFVQQGAKLTGGGETGI